MALSVEEKMLIEQRVTNDAKSAPVAYLLWLFASWVSAHRFYCGKTKSAVVQLVLFWFGLLTSPFIIGLPILLGVAIWVVVDVFLISGWVRGEMEALRARLTAEADAGSMANKVKQEAEVAAPVESEEK